MSKRPDRSLLPTKYDYYECRMIIDCGNCYRCVFCVSFYPTPNHKHKQIVFYKMEWEQIHSDQDKPVICIKEEDILPEIYLPVTKALADALEKTTKDMSIDGLILSQIGQESVKNTDYPNDLSVYLQNRAQCSFRYVVTGICKNPPKAVNCKDCKQYDHLAPNRETPVTTIEPGYCSAIDWAKLTVWDFCVFIKYPIEDWLAEVQAEMIMSNLAGQWVIGNWEIFIDPITMKDRITSKTLEKLERKQQSEYMREPNSEEFGFTPPIRFIPDPH
ncbi:MAG: hypothetical protein ACD_58C00094G0005 [uncultured bacterium]|nr:MAG: hypothetical protein ACD_58C00094G0005 [uncultured bacterium]